MNAEELTGVVGVARHIRAVLPLISGTHSNAGRCCLQREKGDEMSKQKKEEKIDDVEEPLRKINETGFAATTEAAT